MNKKAMYKLSYGLFVLTAQGEGKDNGCIINTAGQAASEPNTLSISMNKANYTHDLVLADGRFNISVLSEDADFELIERFGFHSGRDTDKFAGFGDYERSGNGLAYIKKGTNAFFSGEIFQTADLGSHTLVLAKISGMEVLADTPSITYAYYQDNVKPKAQAPADTKDVIWRCTICGYEYNETLGDPANGIAPGTRFEDIADFLCPICKHPKSDFERVS